MGVAVMAALNILALSNVSDCLTGGIVALKWNGEFPSMTSSGRTSGSAFANSSGPLSLSSAQFALP